jgi:hypothetical protein
VSHRDRAARRRRRRQRGDGRPQRRIALASRKRRATGIEHETCVRVDANRRGAFQQGERRRRRVEIELEPRGADEALA